MNVHLRVEAESMLGGRFVVRQDRQEVARLRLKWRDRGEIVIDGVPLEVTNKGFCSTSWQLRVGGRVVGTARKRAFSGRRAEVDYFGDVFTLRIAGFFSRKWELRRGSRTLGAMRPASLWTRSLEAEFDAEVAVQLRMFALFLVLVLRRRASRSGGAGGGGGGAGAVSV